ncbi:protein croquemort-like [Lycorma delicatula]|uniref:protein croquemort-like n=1 Tax=Lycorma delicatula TaxID=130591 RepID=UPI003F519BAC
MTLGVCAQKTVLFGVGGVLLIVGVVMVCVWPFIFNNILKSQLSLSKGSKTYDMWAETPLPMYIDIYLFNWTNSHDFAAKPLMQEVGPFVFSEHHTKVDVVWNSNDSITYRQYRKWIYHPELSNGSLSDNITNLNVIAVTIGALSKNLSSIAKFSIGEALSLMNEQLIVTKNVSQLLFEGFTDPILKVIEILKQHKIKVPVDFDKFGWFYKRNMSSIPDGLFTMETGQNNIEKLGDVISWNGKSVQPFYSGSCSKVQGSLGELWSPYSAQHDSIKLYASDVCGSIPLTSSGLLSLHDLSGTIFAGNEAVFDNGTKYPESACYCIKDCPASGLRDISACRGGAPVFLSFPHFYLADPSYRNAVDGLKPDSEKHSFRIALEERTGVPLQVKARLQINLFTQPIKDIIFFKKSPQLYMPMIWFDQHAETTESIAHDLHPLSLLATYGTWVLVSVAVVGGLLVLFGLYLKLNKFWDGNIPLSQSETLLTTDN